MDKDSVVKAICLKGGVVYFPEHSNIQTLDFGRRCRVHSHVWIGEDVYIGDRVKIQAFCFIPNGVIIGDDVFLGPRVTFTNDDFSGVYPLKTIVGDGVRIGAGAVILPGLVIGEGATIGAGSVVTKDVKPHTTVYGNPARPA